MTDTKIKAQGAKGDDAIAPQVQINATTNEWEISTDGGKNWKSTGIKATGEKGDRGDAVFAENGVDYTSDPDNVIFTLADGKTKLTVPRTKILSVKFKDGCDIFSVTVSIRPRACFSPSYNKVKSQTKHVWLLTLL